jgi:SAM-dependent methyltransferase
MENGHARTADHFIANVGDNENGVMHPAMFPVTLCEKLIQTFSLEGSVCLDCFCGSGNALLAAKHTGRKFIGIDIKKEYVELAARRLNTAYTEHIKILNPGHPVRLRTDFPDTAKSRCIYFRSRGLKVSDAAIFEFVLSMTVNSSDRTAAAELSHNQIASVTKLSRRTVIRSIERQEKAGLIETVKHEEWHRGNANRIALSSSLLVPLELLPSATKATTRRDGGTRRFSHSEKTG